MANAEYLKLKDAIKYDPKAANFVIASEYSVAEVDDLLAQALGQTGPALTDALMALATTIIEPIDQALPYVMVYTPFFQEVTIGDLEDPAFPVENGVMGICWEVHPESEVFFVRPSFEWYRPGLYEYSAGVEIHWKLVRRAGWNVLARMMRRATDSIARRIDTEAKNNLDASVAGTTRNHIITGGLLTKAIVDAVIKAANTAGFPVTRAAVNSGTVTDMAGWSTGTFSTQTIPEDVTRDLLRTLYLGWYGGINWYSNPFVATNLVYVAGEASRTGWHIQRGRVITSSDVDIRKGIDLHAIRSAEHAFYVDNDNNVRRIEIKA